MKLHVDDRTTERKCVAVIDLAPNDRTAKNVQVEFIKIDDGTGVCMAYETLDIWTAGGLSAVYGSDIFTGLYVAIRVPTDHRNDRTGVSELCAMARHEAIMQGLISGDMWIGEHQTFGETEFSTI